WTRLGDRRGDTPAHERKTVDGNTEPLGIKAAFHLRIDEDAVEASERTLHRSQALSLRDIGEVERKREMRDVATSPAANRFDIVARVTPVADQHVGPAAREDGPHLEARAQTPQVRAGDLAEPLRPLGIHRLPLDLGRPVVD